MLGLQALLQGGSWHSLLPEGHPGIAEVKWCANRFSPYLCINPQAEYFYPSCERMPLPVIFFS